VPPPFDILPTLLSGLGVTVEVTVLSGALGIALAFVAGVARGSDHRTVRIIAGIYVEVFRGTSAIVQLFWLFFALPLLGISLPPLEAGVVALGLNFGAYGAEVVRGAIHAVPKEQQEGAIALNLTPIQRLRRVTLPQAIPIMLPPFGNLLVELLKGTSLVSLVTLQDLTFKGQIVINTTLRTPDVFAQLLCIYFVLAFGLTRLVRFAESRLAVARD
jgi:polar amino acid transport system permease protein